MRRDLSRFQRWGLDYLLIRPAEWQALGQTNGWLRTLRLLNVPQAGWALDAIARHHAGCDFLREIAAGLGIYTAPLTSQPDSYESQRAARHMLDALKDALGRPLLGTGALPPSTARFHVCRRQGHDGPWQAVPQTLSLPEVPLNLRARSITAEARDPLRSPVAGRRRARPTRGHRGVRWHTVRQGQCLSKIAQDYGLSG
jgi:hypothetical protein